MDNMINTNYKVSKITSVMTHNDGSKDLIESEWVGKHTVKEIKESLPETQTFFSVEYEDKTLTFNLDNFNELRLQNQI